VFWWLKDGRQSLAAQPADATAPPKVLLAGRLSPSSWTPDGRQLATARGDDIVILTVENGKVSAQPLFETPHTEWWPEISPDGRWLAYGSNVSGRFEIYVRPYPGPGPAEQVSVDGGESPAWRSDGKELFFLNRTALLWFVPSKPGSAGKRSMMVVDVNAAAARRIGRSRRLFEFDESDLPIGCGPIRCWDVAPDGQRFYVIQRQTPPPPPVVTHINLIQNWFEELKAKVPAGGANQ
jgi:serine/threonine-protein kinase